MRKQGLNMESRYWFQRSMMIRHYPVFVLFGWHRDPKRVAMDGSDKEFKSLFFGALIRAFLTLVFVLYGAGYLIDAFIEQSQARWAETESQSAPIFRDAGTVVSVQLHDTAFSTSTTVTTSIGTFQVSGAVTASPGDVTKMRTEKHSDDQSLCVQSEFKSGCYRLL